MLDEKELNELLPYFEKVAVAQGVEVEDVKETFTSALELVEQTPSVSGKPRRVIIARTKAAMDTIYANRKRKGDLYDFIIFGPMSDPKDWNAGEFAAIKSEIDRGNVKGMINAGKLMNIDGKPLSKVGKLTTVKKWVKDGKLLENMVPDSVEVEVSVPLEDGAEYWQKGQGDPVFRDARTLINGKVNEKHIGKPLDHSWTLKIVGIAWPHKKEEETRLFECMLRYDQADPTSDHYFFKEYDTFVPYSAQFEVGEKSTPWKYILECFRLTPKAADVDMTTFDIELSDFIKSLHENYGEQAKKNNDDIPWFLNGLGSIADYHESSIVIKDGEKQSTQSGYDVTRFNSYAILATHVQSISEPTAKASAKYNFHDSTIDKRMSGFAGKSIFKKPDILPGRCLLMVKTSRDKNRYDAATKTKVFDPENADIKISVLSIGSISDGFDEQIDQIAGL